MGSPPDARSTCGPSFSQTAGYVLMHPLAGWESGFPAGRGKNARPFTFSAFFLRCVICIGMTYSARQRENRRRACRCYRERGRAKGWKSVCYFLPRELALELVGFKEKRVAGYRAKRQGELEPSQDFPTAVHSLSTAPPKTRQSWLSVLASRRGKSGGNASSSNTK